MGIVVCEPFSAVAGPSHGGNTKDKVTQNNGTGSRPYVRPTEPTARSSPPRPAGHKSTPAVEQLDSLPRVFAHQPSPPKNRRSSAAREGRPCRLPSCDTRRNSSASTTWMPDHHPSRNNRISRSTARSRIQTPPFMEATGIRPAQHAYAARSPARFARWIGPLGRPPQFAWRTGSTRARRTDRPRGRPHPSRLHAWRLAGRQPKNGAASPRKPGYPVGLTFYLLVLEVAPDPEDRFHSPQTTDPLFPRTLPRPPPATPSWRSSTCRTLSQLRSYEL